VSWAELKLQDGSQWFPWSRSCFIVAHAAPIIRNAVHPTIPHGVLPQTQAQRQQEYPEAKEDSKAGQSDGSPQ